MIEGDGEFETTTARRSRGDDATFGTDPDAISIELRVGRPGYIRVEEGQYLQEGDAFHRDQIGMRSPTIATWKVVDITPEQVIGREVETGDETQWDREAIEQRLAVGTYSTNLTDFERLSVHEIGQRGDHGENDGISHRYTGPPYVAVVAYGDNGLSYGQRYRFADENSSSLELWTQDGSVERLGVEVRTRLDERVQAALQADGYAVVEPE